MSHVFISHVEEDASIALQIAQGLEQAGYSTWYYERDSLPGVSYLLQTRQAVEQSRAVVVIMSRNSLGSRQVTNEVVRAHESGKYFIPVLHGVSHVEFQRSQPEWAEAIGAAASVSISSAGPAAIVPRIVEGLQALGVEPSEKTSKGAPSEQPAAPGMERAVARPAPAVPPPEKPQVSTWPRVVVTVTAVLVILTVLAKVMGPRPRPNLPDSRVANAEKMPSPGGGTAPGPSETPSATATVRTPVHTLTATPASVPTPQPIQGYALPLTDPFDVVFDGSALWVSYRDRLTRVELVEAEGRFRAAEQMTDFHSGNALCWDPSREQYWVVAGSPHFLGEGIQSVDRSGQVVASFQVPQDLAGAPRRIAWDGQYLWVLPDKGPLQQLKVSADRAELTLVDSYTSVATQASFWSEGGLTWDGSYLWLLAGCNLYKLDGLARPTCSIELPCGRAWRGLAWDGRFLWAADASASTLYRVDPEVCQ